MLIVAPDFARRIDLPGPGPCPRPVDIDRARADLTTLVSLRVYSFAAGNVIDGEAEEDEVYIVLMRGRADIAVDNDGKRVGVFPLGTGGARAVYLPPHAAYRLTAVADCDIAYARCEPAATPFPEPGSFTPSGGRLAVRDHAQRMELALATLPAGAQADIVAGDGHASERFVHIRSDDGAATLSGKRIGDWDSVILSDGETAPFKVLQGTIDLLTISASGS